MKIDKDFYNFLMAEAHGENCDWLENMKEKYQDNRVCNFCQSTNTKVVVSLKFTIKCKACGEFTEVPAHKVNGPFELADPELFQKIARDEMLFETVTENYQSC